MANLQKNKSFKPMLTDKMTLHFKIEINKFRLQKKLIEIEKILKTIISFFILKIFKQKNKTSIEKEYQLSSIKMFQFKEFLQKKILTSEIKSN